VLCECLGPLGVHVLEVDARLEAALHDEATYRRGLGVREAVIEDEPQRGDQSPRRVQKPCGS
jgi:hypothetical protein